MLKKDAHLRRIWDTGKLCPKKDCPLCGRPQNFVERGIRGDGLSIKECLNCGLGFVDPVPGRQELEQYYADGYFMGERSSYSSMNYYIQHDRALKGGGAITGLKELLVEVAVQGKVVLEIGCASGVLLKKISEYGPQRLIGLDMVREAVDFGKAHYGLDLRCGTIENSEFDEEFFDVIIMIDVIEHFLSLNESLLAVKRVLKPGGKLFILTPNYRAVYKTGKNWIQFHQSYEHLQYFSQESLEFLAEKMEMQLMSISSSEFPAVREQYNAKDWRRYFLEPHKGMINLYRKLKYHDCGRKGFGNQLVAVMKKKG